jgi:hypothetical protein
LSALLKNKTNPDEELQAACVRFADDPLGFVKYFYDWGVDELKGEEGPDTWQADVLGEIAAYCRKIARGENPGPCQLAVASGHGIGKSALVSWIVQWFISCRDHPQIVVTANTETQLATKSWRELSRWHKRLANRGWYEWTATKFYLKAHPEDWFASAIPWNENNPEAFSGTHEKHVLVLFDEASKIHDVIWEKVDGAMSTTGSMWICFGNPTRNHGRFYDCFYKDRKYWITRQIDSRTCKKADKVWASRFIERVGLTDDRTKYQILGQFPSAATRQYISSEAVEKCQNHETEGYEFLPKVMGVDVARYGESSSTICLRQGRKVFPIEVLPKQDLMHTAHHIAEAIRKHKPVQTFVDGSGMGAGVVDRLRQLNFQVVDVNGGNSSLNSRFLNKRAEMWTEMKEFIEGLCELPKDSRLKEELTCVEYGFTDKGRIRLQRKEDIMDSYGFSPDKADALAMTFAYPVADFLDSIAVDPPVHQD